MSSFQHKVRTHSKKQESVAHWEKKGGSRNCSDSLRMLNFIDKDLKYDLRSKWVRVSKIKEGVVTMTQQIEHLNKELEILENLMEILELKRCRKWNDNLTRGTQYHSQASMRIWELMCWQRWWTEWERQRG